MSRVWNDRQIISGLLLAFVVLLPYVVLRSQPTFIKKYTVNPEDGDSFRSAINIDDGYVFYNSTVVSVPFSQIQGGLVRTDLSGDTIWSTKWDFLDCRIGVSFDDGLVNAQDSVIAFASFREDSIYSNYALVTTSLSSGDSKVRKFRDSLPWIAGHAFGVDEENLILTGSPFLDREGYFLFSISRLSRTDTQLSSQRYLEDYSFTVVTISATVNDKGEVFAAFRGCKTREGCRQIKGGLLKVKVNGEVDWIQEYGGTAANQTVIPQVAILNDTTLAYSWTRDTNNLDIQESPPVIYFLDTFGNKRDSLAIHGNWRTLTTLRPTANGDLIGSGFAWTDIGWCGWMIRVSPEAELIWERYIQDYRDSPNARTEFTEVIEDSNGDVLGAGYIVESQIPEDGSSRLKGWVVKLDANGCLEPGCTSDTIYLQDPVAVEEILSSNNEFVELFPNPASDFINLRIEQSPWLVNGGDYQIISSSGRIYAQGTFTGRDKQISISELPNGLYFIKMEVNGRILASVRFVKAS